MWTAIFFLCLYFLSLNTVIKAAIKGKGLFFPNFRRIDEAYNHSEKVWNSWWGIIGYYIQLLFHLTVFFFLFLFIVGTVIVICTEEEFKESFSEMNTGMKIGTVVSTLIFYTIITSPVWTAIRCFVRNRETVIR